MPDPPTYHIVRIPKLSEDDNDVTALALKYREFRLRSLKEAPNSFASTYETESKRELDQSIQRLTNQKAAQFIALRSIDQTQYTEGVDGILARLLDDEWVGAVVLLGPEEGDEFSIPSANIDPFNKMTATTPAWHSTRLFEKAEDPRDMHFHINGTFVDLSARGNRLGDRLMEAALRAGEAEAVKHDRTLRVTLSVYGDNLAARHLYDKAGFRVIKEAESRSRPGNRAVHMQYDKPIES